MRRSTNNEGESSWKRTKARNDDELHNYHEAKDVKMVHKDWAYDETNLEERSI